MKYVTSALFIAIIIISCNHLNNKKACSTHDSYELQETVGKDLQFPINDNTKFQFSSLFPYTDKSGQEYLTFLSQMNNEIHFYNLLTGEYLFNTVFEKEGPDGVGFVQGYHMEDLEHIYITSQHSGLSRTDTSGTKKQFIEYGVTNNGYHLVPNFTSSSYHYAPAIIHHGKIYITQGSYPGVEKSAIPVSVVIDTLLQTIEELPFRYPKLITDDTPMEKITGIPFSREFDGKQFIYSFHMDENIYITDIETNEEKRLPAPSKYIQQLKPIQITDDREMVYKNLLESSYYFNILYDKYRNVYYRFAILGSEITNNPEYTFFDIFTNGYIRFSVIILDENFKIIGETLFPKFTYNPSIAFVHKEGLYISSSHIFNPSFDENMLGFQCFTLKKTE